MHNDTIKLSKHSLNTYSVETYQLVIDNQPSIEYEETKKREIELREINEYQWVFNY